MEKSKGHFAVHFQTGCMKTKTNYEKPKTLILNYVADGN